MEDTVLFEQIRLGNKKAFEAIFRRFYVSMCSVAYRYPRDASAAEDIAQEAFLKLWEKRDSYRDIPDLKTFLYVAVKNLSLNYLRDKKDNIECSRLELVSSENFFCSQLVREETFRIISEAVNSLPLQSAKIMNLVLKGKQNKEIAGLLGISVATVKTLKYNALRTLKSKLGKYDYLLLVMLMRKI